MITIEVATAVRAAVRRAANAGADTPHITVRSPDRRSMPVWDSSADVDVCIISLDSEPAVRPWILPHTPGQGRPPYALLMCTISIAAGTLYECLRQGVTGVVDETATWAEIVAAVEVVSKGNFYLSASFQSRWQAHFLTALEESAVRRPLTLTPREVDVLSHLSAGECNEEIARSLRIRRSTVDTHLQSIYRKLAVKNRTQAVIVGLEYVKRLGTLPLAAAGSDLAEPNQIVGGAAVAWPP